MALAHRYPVDDVFWGSSRDPTAASSPGRPTRRRPRPNALSGLAGNNFIDGGDGDDTLIGNANADTILGALGNDRVEGRGGSDDLLGNTGSDTGLPVAAAAIPPPAGHRATSTRSTAGPGTTVCAATRAKRLRPRLAVRTTTPLPAGRR